MSLVFNIREDKDFKAARAAEGRDNGSWSRPIWEDRIENGARVSIWKADPGLYLFPIRPLEETFVVLEGNAVCRLGDDQHFEITEGSIVIIPKGQTISLDVTVPLRKVAFVVPKP